uniref:Reverse transcriptase Ty1/copia-type domain-containing protein n=1 Tax=Solanum lycopersicum TaxID=4081 RepID=A0A3Q7HMS5_SOLLC
MIFYLSSGSNNSYIQETIKLLGDRFSIKDLGHLHFFLSVVVIQHANGFTLTQSTTSDVLSLYDGSFPTDTIIYRQTCFAVNKLAQFQSSLSAKHLQATKRLLRYLKDTITYGLHFKHGNSSQLLAYSDADWDGILDTRHSTFQRIVGSVVAKLNWLMNLLQELRVKMCRNPVFHNLMKHFAINSHFVRNQVESRQISVHHIPTGAQLANALTKALPKRSFVNFVSNIGLKQIEPILRWSMWVSFMIDWGCDNTPLQRRHSRRNISSRQVIPV